MNIDKIIAAIPGMAAMDRLTIRTRAQAWLAGDSEENKIAAAAMLAALDSAISNESAALFERLKDLPVARRVVEAFTAQPMTDNERKTIQALLDNPGTTTTDLSRACGHDSMIWQMHFGNLCKERQAYLWPAPAASARAGSFFSGILADVDGANRFTMKPDVAAAFAELGMVGKRKAAP